jgi:hypothetical protein
MERGLRAPFSPHEEVTFRRIALGISKAKHLSARDVAYLIRLRLVEEKEGRLRLTVLGRERYQGLPNDAAMLSVKDEAIAVLRRHLLQARDDTAGMPDSLLFSPPDAKLVGLPRRFKRASERGRTMEKGARSRGVTSNDRRF